MLTLASWMHDLSPFVWRFTPTFGIRWYGLAYVAGFIAGWFILSRLAKRGAISLPAERVGDFILGVVVGTIVGGRLGYELFTEFSNAAPWWGLLAINQGGMASHGGMVGIIAACAIMARWWRLPTLHLMDCLALVAPVGIFFGRLANFINGELLGKVVSGPGERGPWWAVKFPQELLERRDLEQMKRLADAAPDLAVRLDAETIIQDDGKVSDAIERIQHGDRDLAALIEPILNSRHPSQIYQAIAEGVVLGLVLVWVWRRKPSPGVVTAWFFIVYGVGRVITELWRLPDAQFGASGKIYGLSRGQWLSVGMVAVGVAMRWWVGRTKKTPARAGDSAV
jgi:phosphatidylglycerol---prolipoprotein diacylglyceryl transferase